MSRLTESQIEDFLAFAHRLADEAGKITLRYFRQRIDIDNKKPEGFDPVTLADREAEAAMRALIEKRYPEHGMLGEEHGHAVTANGLTWVIDPIDGTRAFITGSPLWGTLIALSAEAGPRIGILDQPFLGERFWGICAGERKEAFYRRGGAPQPLKTRSCASLDLAMLSTTTEEVFADAGELAAFRALARQVRQMRFGGDCYQYGLVAMGFLDLVVESTLKAYDIHALIPIIEGAGGIVTTWQGASAKDGGRIIAAGDAHIHRAAIEILQAACK